MPKTSLHQVYKFLSVKRGGWKEWSEIKEAFGVTLPNKREISLTDVLETKGLRIALICFSGIVGFSAKKREYIFWCLKQVKHIIQNEACLAYIVHLENAPLNPDASFEAKTFELFRRLELDAEGEYLSDEEIELTKELHQLQLDSHYVNEDGIRVTQKQLKIIKKKLEEFELRTSFTKRYSQRSTFREFRITAILLRSREYKDFLGELATGARENFTLSENLNDPRVSKDSEYWKIRRALCERLNISRYSDFYKIVDLTQQLANFDQNLIALQKQKLREIFSRLSNAAL